MLYRLLHLPALAVIVAACSASGPPLLADDGLRERIKDENAGDTDLWIYNDVATAREEAKRQNKPLFVTFRCVPCRDCKAFDAEVAKGNEAVHKLAREKFIPVRQVEMEGVDLSQFQFDYDLNWAAMFLNADGTVYARYGTQSAAGADAYNSIEGLLNTMQRVLELHEKYPANTAELAGKRGESKPYKTALEMPGLQNKERFRGETTRQNCIHCHMIHDAEHFAAQDSGTFSKDMLWRFPLPENLGIVIDAKDGARIERVTQNTPAARAALKPGEDVTHIAGQPITSIADIQWALDQLPNSDTQVTITGSRSGKQTLALKAGWKETDVSWRGSMWSVSPRLRVWAPELTPKEKQERNIPATQSAYLVRWINGNEPGGRAAKESGLRQGDVIVALAGKTVNMTPPQFNMHIKLNYEVGQKLPLTVLRNGKRQELQIELVE